MRCFAGRRVLLPVLLAGSMVASARAQTLPADPVFDSVTLFVAQGADHNLKELPERIVAGNPSWEKSYFKAVGLARTESTLGQGWERLQGTPLASIARGYEVVLAQHHGMQDNSEAGAAYTLRTPDLELGSMGVNFGSGVGLSYALGTPTYEDGPKTDPEKRYRLQLLLLFELEWRVRQLEDMAFVTRVHHRSGVYGLIAPRHVGSNFLAAGIRYRF